MKAMSFSGLTREQQREKAKRARGYLQLGLPWNQVVRLTDESREEMAKEHGMEKSASKHEWILGIARNAARYVYNRDGTVSIDSVRKQLEYWCIGFKPGNWMGSVFKGGDWVPTGRWVKTTHRDGHRRAVREWTRKKYQ